MALIEKKLEEHDMLKTVKRKVVKLAVHQSRIIPD